MAFLDKNVKHSCFESWTDRVTVCFPAAIKQVDLECSREPVRRRLSELQRRESRDQLHGSTFRIG